MVLGEQPPGRVGRRPFILLRKEPLHAALFRASGASSGCECCSRARACCQLAPVRIELAQPADALAERRMRDEQRREPLLHERVDRVQRLGRRARLERHELGGLLEADERVREAVRRAAELSGDAVGLELPLRREQRDGRTPPRPGRARTAAPAGTTRRCALASIDRRGERRRRPSAPARRGARMCASSCASTPSSSAGGHAPSSRRETASAELPSAPRPVASARGIAVGDEVEPRLHDARARRQPLDGRVEQRRLGRAAARARRPCPSTTRSNVPVRAADEQERRRTTKIESRR